MAIYFKRALRTYLNLFSYYYYYFWKKNYIDNLFRYDFCNHILHILYSLFILTFHMVSFSPTIPGFFQLLTSHFSGEFRCLSYLYSFFPTLTHGRLPSFWKSCDEFITKRHVQMITKYLVRCKTSYLLRKTWFD